MSNLGSDGLPPDMPTQRTTTCDECPFSSKTPKSYLDTRGENGHRFIGQAVAGMVLPCHRESKDNNAKMDGSSKLCAGAAIYRRNCGVESVHERMRVSDDVVDAHVFKSHDELLSHHLEIGIIAAKYMLMVIPPEQLAEMELTEAYAKGNAMKIEREEDAS
jgi:hypothetical protein